MLPSVVILPKPTVAPDTQLWVSVEFMVDTLRHGAVSVPVMTSCVPPLKQFSPCKGGVTPNSQVGMGTR